MGQLEAGSDVTQIPLDDVAINPFEWNIDETVDLSSTGTTTPQVDPAELARREREQNIQSEFSVLRLNSVIGGSMPVARISGELVREGDKLGTFFTVKQISTREVVLTVDGKDFVLSMEQ
jgi:hypothetical protein